MRAGLIVALLSLAGCATVPQHSACTALGAGVRYCLQPLPAGQVLAVNQWVEISVADRPAGERLVFAIDAAGARMDVVGLSPLGQKVFRVTTDHGTLRWDGPQAAEALGRQLPALIQLMLWPEAAVREGLSAGATLAVSAHERRLSGDDTLLLTSRQSASTPAEGAIDARFTQLDARIRITPLED
ncbi:MAG: DUF3261 domain-containing protein [Proteobacteria bacterium]|nr:MAG: DUF3261 domain-containing protein [Pseudomonadota bacterium]